MLGQCTSGFVVEIGSVGTDPLFVRGVYIDTSLQAGEDTPGGQVRPDVRQA